MLINDFAEQSSEYLRIMLTMQHDMEPAVATLQPPSFASDFHQPPRMMKMPSYTSRTRSAEPCFLRSSVSAIVPTTVTSFSFGTASDGRCSCGGGRAPAASHVARIRPHAVLASDALMAEYRDDNAASRWARVRLLFIGEHDEKA